MAVRGSVIDYTYGGGTTPAVLIVMDRLQRDFYTAIKTGFDWMDRCVCTRQDLLIYCRLLSLCDIKHCHDENYDNKFCRRLTLTSQEYDLFILPEFHILLNLQCQ